MRISWVSYLTLDEDLHKTREIEILKALGQRGHVTTLVAATSAHRFTIEDKRVKLISVPIRSAPLFSHVIYTAFLFLFLPFHILMEKPDFIIMDPSISVVSSVPSTLFSRLSKTNFILDIKSIPVEVRGLSAKLAEFWFNISVVIAKMRFDGIAIVTEMMKKEICQKFGINERSVSVWTNGVSTDLFNPALTHKESTMLKELMGLNNKFVVFYHGVFSPTRGLTECIEAMQIVSQKNPQVVLLLLGKGINLKEMVVKGHLENNVIFHDPVSFEEVPKFIGLIDLGLVPLPNNSYWRFQNPLNLLEYLAMEKVVLATDIPANRTVVGDEECCIYLHSVKPAEIADSIEYAYSNQDNFVSAGKIGRKIIQRNYTWERIAQKIESYFLRIRLHQPKKNHSGKSEILDKP